MPLFITQLVLNSEATEVCYLYKYLKPQVNTQYILSKC